MKKILVASLALVVVALVATLAYFKGRRYEVVITQPQIDAVLAKNFRFQNATFSSSTSPIRIRWSHCCRFQIECGSG